MSRLLLHAMLAAALLLGAAPGAAEDRPGPRYPSGTSRREAGEGLLAHSVHVPEAFRPGKDRWPLVVALHEIGSADDILVESLAPLAKEGRLLLLCPKARGMGFADSDLDALVSTVRAVRTALGARDCHLLGVGDAGQRALRFAFSRPKAFRSVVTLGTDVPEVELGPGAGGLRVLVMKGREDRAGAARESLERVRDRVELAEFREVAGMGRALEPETRAYVQYFIDAAAGRCEAGVDRSLPWRNAARGLAERKAKELPALVYLFDAAPAYRDRTRTIQNEVFFDGRVRRAAEGAVPILSPRADAPKVVPGARLAPGPAIVVLDRKGKVAGVLQRKPGARALAALLESQ